MSLKINAGSGQSPSGEGWMIGSILLALLIVFTASVCEKLTEKDGIDPFRRVNAEGIEECLVVELYKDYGELVWGPCNH